MRIFPGFATMTILRIFSVFAMMSFCCNSLIFTSSWRVTGIGHGKCCTSCTALSTAIETSSICPRPWNTYLYLSTRGSLERGVHPLEERDINWSDIDEDEE